MQVPEFLGIEVDEQTVRIDQGTVPVARIKASVRHVGGKRKLTADRIALGPLGMAMAKKEGGQLALELESAGRTVIIPLNEADEEAARSFAHALTQYGKSMRVPKTQMQSRLAAQTGVPQTEDPDMEAPEAQVPQTEVLQIRQSADVRVVTAAGQAQSLMAKAKKRAQEGIRQSLEEDEKVQVVILGEWSQLLAATDRRAFVYKGGITTGSFFSRQLNSWDYRNISGVELRKNLTVQTVILQVPGIAPVTKTGRMDKGPNSSWEAPNAIMVSNSTDLARSISDIRALIAQFHQLTSVSSAPSSPQGPDPIEQVKRLAELRDEGILTDEEFQAKKRDLLGL